MDHDPPATDPPKKKKYRMKSYTEYDIPTAAQVMNTVVKLRKKTNARYPRNKMRLIVLVMLSSCGLRASELLNLNMEDVACDIGRPHVRVTVSINKSRRTRTIPLTWAPQLLPDIQAWKRMRESMGAGPKDPFLVSLVKRNLGQRLKRKHVRAWAMSAMRYGKFWTKGFTAHTLRHFFATYAIADHRIGFNRVREALGHEDLSMTGRYAHATPDAAVYADFFGKAASLGQTDTSTDGTDKSTTQPQG